jgi:TetR/AcrR family transcriptional regulator
VPGFASDYQCNKPRGKLSTVWLKMTKTIGKPAQSAAGAQRTTRPKAAGATPRLRQAVAPARKTAGKAQKSAGARRDPEATRAKLLAAARREFAEKGLAGARVDEIAERAGVNKQLVYHYFGDKDAIYLAVLEWIYDEIRSHERQLNLTGLPPDKAIRKLIESSFDHLAAHPDFVALLNDENRHGARHVRRSGRLPQMHSPLVGLVEEILAEGVRGGIFRRGIDPMHLYISIAGLGYFFFSNRPTLSAIFSQDLGTPASLRARRRHVVDLVMHALRPD